MRLRFATAILVLIRALCVLAVGLVPTIAAAQSQFGAPLGTIALSASPTGYVPVLDAPRVGDVIEFYVIVEVDFSSLPNAGENQDNGVLAWEAAVVLPPELTLLDTALNPPGGVDLGSGPTDWIVGVGPAGLPAKSTPFAVVTVRVRVASPIVQALRLELVAPTRPSLDPPVPAWVESQPVNGCTNPLYGTPTECLRPFASVLPLDLPRTVALRRSAWGPLKARYGG